MTYKRRPQKPRYIPLARYTFAGLPKKVKRKLENATFVATMRCGVCGENTQLLFKAKPPAKGGRLVCMNPKCEVYGMVVPV